MYEANHFLKMFPDRGQSFNGLKHLTEKVAAVASLTLTAAYYSFIDPEKD